MRRKCREKNDKYRIIIKRLEGNETIETDVMGDRETREVLYLIGKLNLRSAFAS